MDQWTLPRRSLHAVHSFDNPDAGFHCDGQSLACRVRDECSPAFAASALSALDSDKDGTVDLAEAKAAATARFDKLEKDNDGTLDHKELKGRVSEKDWAIADPDNDKTISKDEYLAFVEVAFKGADEDNDRTIDAKELRGPAGRALLRLLK